MTCNCFNYCLDEMEPIFTKEKLSFDEVVDILQNNRDIDKDCQPLVRPKGHQVFLFSAEDKPVQKMIGDVTNIDG